MSLATPYLRQEFSAGQELELIPYGDRSRLNETLSVLLQNETKRRAMAAAGRKAALARHTWDARAQQILGVLPQLLTKLGG